MRGHVLAVAALVGASGCAYFNGLYNANRLAGEARHAEREGRVGEARSLWSQAAVKAESVAVRYPESRYNDDALLLWGQALRSAGRCRDAIGPLEATVRTSPSAELRRRARVGLGECLVRTGWADSAVVILAPVVADSESSPLAADAALWMGRSHLALRRPRHAVDALQLADRTEAAFDLAHAHQRLGDVGAAARVLESRVAGPYDEPQWAAALDTLAGASQDTAARLVSRLAERRGLTPGEKARVLLADGERWSLRGQEQAARARFEEARSLASDSVEGRVADVRLAEWELRRARAVEQLPPLLERFEAATRAGGTPARLAGRYVSLLRTALLLHEQDDVPDGEFRMVLLAEALRDSARADVLAASVLMEVPARYPESPFAPKALLAVAMLDAGRASEARAILLSRYSDSPYTAVALGRADPRYGVLEDSLRIALAAARDQATSPVGREPEDRELPNERRSR